MVLARNTLVPGQQSLAFFSAGEPASVFTGTVGVVAGTGSLIVRRWSGRGGGRRGGPGIAGSQSSPGALSLEQVSAPGLLGETDSCGVVSESSIQAGLRILLKMRTSLLLVPRMFLTMCRSSFLVLLVLVLAF